MERTTAQLEESRKRAVLLAEEMRSAVAPVRIEVGGIVARQGERGRRFYFVDSGALDVVVTSENGLRLPIARLGPGSHFGEMSLLADVPVSADVVASEPSVLYGVAPEQFAELIRRRPELVEYLAGELAIRLKQTNEQLAAHEQRQAVLSSLISSRPSTAFKDDLPSFDKQLLAAIAVSADSDLPLLISGDRGVGKKALALSIHATGARSNTPVLVVDCRELPQDEARSFLFGDASPESVSRFSDHLGYVQAADRGTLILAHIDRLPPEAQDDLAAFIRSYSNASRDFRVIVRVIGTVGAAGGASASSGLSEALADAFACGQSIQLRPLRRRRRDIVPLAEHFLRQAAQLSGRHQKQFSESARRRLLSYDFRFENVEELRQVVKLGLDLADSEVISAEHLFFGAGVWAETPQIDLLRWPWVEQLVTRGRLLAGTRVAIGIAFASIAGVCLIAPDSRAGRVANVMAWGLWWPGLIILSVLLGRVWCAVCPLSSGAEVIQQRSGRGLPPMSWLKDAWPVPALIGFGGIIWIEHVTDMSAHPRATAVLLLSLAVIAAAVGWLYQRHTWCRWLCPLGAMSAAFSTVSALRVRARREVCQASCTKNECYKGSEQAKGCPMFNHVLFLNSGEHCKLCLECIRACPVQSPRLLLQLPLRDVWGSDLIATEMAPLTVVIGLMALLLAAAPRMGSGSLSGHWWFTLGALAVVAAGLGLQRAFRPRMQTAGEDSASWAGRAVYAYAPVVAAALFAFHILSLPWLGEVFLRIGGSDTDLLRVSLLHMTQAAALCTGGLMTLWTLWHLCRQRFGPALTMPVAIYVPLSALAVAYLVGGLMLLGRAPR